MSILCKLFPDDKLTMDHVSQKAAAEQQLGKLSCCVYEVQSKKGSRTIKESGMKPLKKQIRQKANILRTFSKPINYLLKDYLW